MRPDDLIGYTYCGDNYCGAHILHAMNRDAADDVELALEAIANEDGIDRADESSFDSEDFPKVLHRDAVRPLPKGGDTGEGPYSDRCGVCGVVLADQPAISWRAAADQREELTGVLNGYMDCALWSSSDAEETPLDDNYSTADIDAETRREMRRDCARFVAENRDELERFSTLTGRGLSSLGHDFWLTRNHHGAGFWDRYLEADRKDQSAVKKLGERLTLAAEQFSEYNLAPRGDEVGKM